MSLTWHIQSVEKQKEKETRTFSIKCQLSSSSPFATTQLFFLCGLWAVLARSRWNSYVFASEHDEANQIRSTYELHFSLLFSFFLHKFIIIKVPFSANKNLSIFSFWPHTTRTFFINVWQKRSFFPLEIVKALNEIFFEISATFLRGHKFSMACGRAQHGNCEIVHDWIN